MAEPTQPSMIDRLRGFIPGPVASALDPVAPLREMLQRFTMGAPARPPEPALRPAPIEGGTPVTLPTAPAPQGPRRAAVVTPGTASTPEPAPAPAPEMGPPQPSLLESLRQAVARDIAPMSSAERMGAFGRGVLSNRGSFLDNLSAGLAAQDQAEAARRAELRQSIETQARLAEQERKGQLEKAQFSEATSPESLTGRLRESQIAENVARARYYEQGGRGGAGGGGGARNRITPQLYSQMYNQAEQEARRQFPDPLPGMVERPGEAETRRTNREAYRDRRLQQLLEGASQIQQGNLPTQGQAAPQAAAPAPAATIDASGRPIR